MLKDSFYHIISNSHQDNIILVALEFDAAHPIFAGHFPGQPVVPGACMLQMVKEMLGDALKSPSHLKKADHLKFIAPIDPNMADELEMKLTYKAVEAGLQVIAVLTANGVACFKMQGTWAS